MENAPIKNCLIVVSGNDPEYHGRVIELATKMKDSGTNPVVVDLSKLNAGIGNAYNEKYLMLFRAVSPSVKFHATLSEELHRKLLMTQLPGVPSTRNYVSQIS